MFRPPYTCTSSSWCSFTIPSQSCPTLASCPTPFNPATSFPFSTLPIIITPLHWKHYLAIYQIFGHMTTFLKTYILTPLAQAPPPPAVRPFSPSVPPTPDSPATHTHTHTHTQTHTLLIHPPHNHLPQAPHSQCLSLLSHNHSPHLPSPLGKQRTLTCLTTQPQISVLQNRQESAARSKWVQVTTLPVGLSPVKRFLACS
jgi:hypothetical protein